MDEASATRPTLRLYLLKPWYYLHDPSKNAGYL